MTKRNGIDGESYLDPYLGQSIDERANVAQKEGSAVSRFLAILLVIASIAAAVFFGYLAAVFSKSGDKS